MQSPNGGQGHCQPAKAEMLNIQHCLKRHCKMGCDKHPAHPTDGPCFPQRQQVHDDCPQTVFNQGHKSQSLKQTASFPKNPESQHNRKKETGCRTVWNENQKNRLCNLQLPTVPYVSIYRTAQIDEEQKN